MSSRNLASTPVLSAVVALAEIPSCTHSVCCWSTRHAVAYLSDWSKTQTISAPGVRVSLGPLMAELWLKWMSMAPSLMLKPLSATLVICCTQVGAATVPLLPDAVWSGKVKETHAYPNLQTALTQDTCLGAWMETDYIGRLEHDSSNYVFASQRYIIKPC